MYHCKCDHHWQPWLQICHQEASVQHRIKYLQNERETSGRESCVVTSFVLLSESTGQRKKSLPPSSIISTWVTSKEFVFYCQLLEGSPPGLWYWWECMVSAHEMPQKELTLQRLPIPACSVWFLRHLWKLPAHLKAFRHFQLHIMTPLRHHLKYVVGRDICCFLYNQLSKKQPLLKEKASPVLMANSLLVQF